MARLPLSDPTVVLTCDKCGRTGPANEVFYLRSNGALTQSHCRECEQQRVREHEKRRPVYGPPVPIGHRIRGVIRGRNTKVFEVDGVPMRACTRCEKVLPVERFTVHKSGQVMAQCKECRSAFEKAQREDGKRKERDPAHQRELSRVWREANRERSRMSVRRRRARLREAGPMLSIDEWQDIQAAWGHRCAYCNVHAPGELTMDHVIPVSRGGDSAVENISPACGPKHNNCNARKAAQTGMEFMHGPMRPVRVA